MCKSDSPDITLFDNYLVVNERQLVLSGFCFVTAAQVRFNSPNGVKQSGWLREWTLMLHGTREAPYVDLPAGDQHSKLAIVKKAHEERLKARK